MNNYEKPHTLPKGYILKNKYIIDSVSGEGGFGITYVGHIKDSSPQENIAIKEYFPSGVASRDYSDSPYTVIHFGGDFSISFQKGLQRFLNEAVLLKQFSYLESIVSILDVFEANHTAYLIMEYIEGISLKQLITKEGPLPFSDIYNLLLPVMKDLAIIHEHGLIHRDISPDNLLIGLDNHLHLIDFGSVSVANPNESKTVTVILKAGYAPPEQYIANGHIGPWTDVYGLCGTIYYALIGNCPVDALIRIQNKDKNYFVTPDNSYIKDYQWSAVKRGLSLEYADRFSSVKQLYHALSTPLMHDEPITVIMTEASYINNNTKANDTNKHTTNYNRRNYHPLIITIALLITIVIGIGGNILINHETASIHIANTNIAPQTKKHLSMINLYGLTLENAAMKLSDLDPSIELKTVYKYDPNNDIGIVISQSVPADSTFTEGELSELTLTISKGAEPTTEAIYSDDQDMTTENAASNNSVDTGNNNANNTDNSSVTNTNTDSTGSKSKKSQQSTSKKETPSKSTESEYTTIHLD